MFNKIVGMFKDSTEQECANCGNPTASASEIYCPFNHAESIFCSPCNTNYIEHKIEEGFFGFCPNIRCPQGHTKEDAYLLSFVAWSKEVSPKAVEKYNRLAQSVLAILCASCHKQSTTLVKTDPDIQDQYNVQLKQLIGTTEYEIIMAAISRFCEGIETIEVLYDCLLASCPTLNSGEDAEAWRIMNAILSTILDPERRATLQLRYFNSRPLIKSVCCGYTHCWRCKTKSHDGKTCEDFQQSLDNSVVPCPQCGVSLSKGDGCNSVTCFCGFQFGWTEQKKKIENSTMFKAAYPDNTTDACVRILTDECDTKLIELSQGWRSTHTVEVNQSLMRWWYQQFPMCPAQCAAFPPKGLDRFVGRCEALKLFKGKYSRDVTHCETETQKTILKLFPSIFRTPEERAAAALSMLKYNMKSDAFLKNDMILRSARSWAMANKEAMVAEESLFCQRSTLRLLRTFGSLSLKETALWSSSVFLLKDCCSSFSVTGLSNEALQFDSHAESAKRVGGASCYPAAFIPLVSGNCKVTIELTEAALTVNFMSFGLCLKGFPKSSSDGFGRTSNSWGVCDNRNRSAEPEMAFVGYNGNRVLDCRKFQQGDMIALSVDLDKLCFEFNLNEGEFAHEFQLPPGISFEDFCFGATFANDHKITIISNIDSSSREVSADKIVMIRASVKALEEIKRSQHVSPSFHEYALQWESTYSESKERLFAYSAFEEAWSTKTISLRTLCQIEELAGMSWKQLFGIVCWGILNADLYEEFTREGLAISHMTEHTDSAAFMAAEIHHLAQFDKSLTESKSMKKAKAYMLYFSEEMHSWFDYNDSLQDPIIPKSACNCRCLPRHVKHCPTPRILQDDGGWCEAKPKRKRNTKNTSKSKSSTLGVAASGPS